MSVMPIKAACVRCHSEQVKFYGQRILCLMCGFTFHVTATDETDEMVSLIPKGAR